MLNAALARLFPAATWESDKIPAGVAEIRNGVETGICVDRKGLNAMSSIARRVLSKPA